MSEYLHTYFVFEEEPSSSKVRSCLNFLFDNGLKPYSSDTESFTYRGADTDFSDVEIDRKEGIQRLSQHRKGSISGGLGYGDIDVSLNFGLNSQLVPDELYWAGVAMDPVYLRRYYEDIDVEKNIEDYIELTTKLAVKLNPEFSFGISNYSTANVERSQVDLDKFKQNTLWRIYWLNIFSKPFLENVTKKKAERSPAFRTEVLENGQILLLTTSHPFDYRDSQDKFESYFGIKN